MYIRKHNRYCSAGMVAVCLSIVVFFFLYSLFTPYALDEVNFRNMYLGYNNGSEAFSLKPFFEYVDELRTNDNGRLANILCLLVVLYVPKWLFALLSGLGALAMYRMMCALAEIEHDRLTGMLLIAWLSSVVLLPWRNSIIICDYLLNYLYTSVAVAGFLLILQRVCRKSLGIPAFILAGMLAVVAGWMHEGFSIPVCFGLAVFAVGKRFKLPLQWWILCFLFGVAALYMTFAPGTLSRLDREINGHGIMEKIKILLTVLPAVCLTLACGVAAVFSVRLRILWKNILASDSGKILVTATLIASFITLGVNSDSRAGWPAELFALILLMRLTQNVGIRYPLLRKYVLAVLYILGSVFFANVIRWQYVFYKQHVEIEKKLAESADGTVYYDIVDPETCRVETLFLPTRYLWAINFNYLVLNNFYEDVGRIQAVVPTALEDFDVDKAAIVKSTNGLREWRGVLVAVEDDYVGERDFENFTRNQLYDFTLTDGTVLKDITCLVLKFTANDGRRYNYIRPVYSLGADIVEAKAKDVVK